MPKIKTNGINLYYETYGVGEPMVFVAGFSADHRAWQNVIDTYAKRYQVIVFDNRGIGQSDCPDYPYTTEMMADDVVGLIHELKLKNPYLIGHSFGGCIVQTVLKNHPTLAKSAILVTAPYKLNIRARLYTEARLELMKANAPEKSVVKFITLLCWSDRYLSQPGMAKQLVKDGFFPITITGYENQLNAALTFNSQEWLHKIQTPCLIIGADDDLCVSETETEFLAANIPNTEYFCLQDVGHVPMVEQPDAFNELVLNFIATMGVTLEEGAASFN
jgi:pimeloyl-ACP methyl ester carboxylesterase